MFAFPNEFSSNISTGLILSSAYSIHCPSEFNECCKEHIIYHYLANERFRKGKEFCHFYIYWFHDV